MTRFDVTLYHLLSKCQGNILLKKLWVVLSKMYHINILNLNFPKHTYYYTTKQNIAWIFQESCGCACLNRLPSSALPNNTMKIFVHYPFQVISFCEKLILTKQLEKQYEIAVDPSHCGAALAETKESAFANTHLFCATPTLLTCSLKLLCQCWGLCQPIDLHNIMQYQSILLHAKDNAGGARGQMEFAWTRSFGWNLVKSLPQELYFPSGKLHWEGQLPIKRNPAAPKFCKYPLLFSKFSVLIPF